MTSPEERVQVSQLSRRGPATLIAGLRTPGLAHVRAKKRRNKAVLEMRGFLSATIADLDQLELSDLVEQLTVAPIPGPTLLVHLKALRQARNKLSHLTPVNV